MPTLSKKKVAIIGTGLTALGALLALKNRAEIHVYDVVPKYPKRDFFGSKFSDFELFDHSVDLKKVDSLVEAQKSIKFPRGHDSNSRDFQFPPDYFALGGQSNVWGAAIASSEIELMFPKKSLGEEISDSIKELKGFLKIQEAPFLSPMSQTLLSKGRNVLGDQISISKLAFNKKLVSESCSGCGMCLSGCNRDLIFSSANTFTEFEKSGLCKIHYEHKLAVIKCSENKCGLTFSNGVSEEFDYVFLATGVLATIEVLFNSGICEADFIDIRQSAKAIVPAISMSFEEKPQLFFSNTNLSIKRRYGSSRDLDYYAQLSPISKISLVQQKLHRGFLKHLFPFIQRQGFGALLGISSDTSPTIRMDIVNKKFEIIGGASALKSAVRDLMKTFLKMNCLPIFPLNKLLINGSGNHLGACFPLSKGQNAFVTDDLGRLKKSKNLSILGPSTLPYIPDHGIGIVSAANANRIAKNIFL